MDPALRQLLRAEVAGPRRELEAIVRLRHPGVEVPGVRVVARFNSIATCRVAAGAVRAVWRHPDVASLKAPRPLGPERQPAGPPGRSLARRPGDRRAPADDALDGAGVVVGVVDWGLDVDHPSFRRDDGGTRVLALWDQRGGGPGSPPAPYGYGRLHGRERIDAALRTPSPYEALGYHPGEADRGGGSHGCHVADIAAGNGRSGGPCGVAPEASLVFVHLADRGTSGLATLGDSVRLLEAVDFVRRVAAERPWVVNLSVGRHGGPHDGCTLVELAIDELLSAAPGRFVVQSAGNYHRARTHACGTVAQGSTRTLTFRTHPEDTSANELELWYDGADALALRLTPPLSSPGPWVHLGEEAAVVARGETAGWVYHRARDPNNQDHHVDVFLAPSAPAGAWLVELCGERVVSGRFHAWLERDDECPRCQARFAPDDSDATGTTGTIANGRLALVVGAYDAHRGARPVAAFSSSGPTRDGRTKPDLLAPGVAVLAARSAPPGTPASPGLLVRKSGTSMAAPHVTGAVALCLQATGGRLSASEIRDLVLGATRPAPDVPRARAGAGYLDLPRLLSAVRRHPRALPVPHPSQERAMQPLPVVPAQAFRELLYRPDSDVGRWVGSHFQVLAGPGQPVTSPPRRGDLLLEVPLGRPGPGTAVPVQHRYAVPSRLGPGQLLLHPRVGDGDAPDIEEDAESVPAHVPRARRVWARLFRGSSVLRAVRIEDLSCAPSQHIATSDFSAWTNSPTDVFVSDVGQDDAVWEAVLHHESLHVLQFRKAGGKPPQDYATMMRYECDAYTQSALWVASRKRPDPHGLAGQMRARAQMFRKEVVETQRSTQDAKEREQRYRRFLLDADLLPPHRRIADLYTLTPGRTPCSTPTPTPTPTSPPSDVQDEDAADADDLAAEFLVAGFEVGPGEQDDVWLDAGPEGVEQEGEQDAGLAEFSGPEHRKIGDLAAGQEQTTLLYGDPPRSLGLGEVVALAGDYFTTYTEMAELSRTAKGRAQLAYARWHGLGLGRQQVPEPRVDDAVRKAVLDRYLLLASKNISHFSGGGTAWQAYVTWHAKALVDALDAGQRSDSKVWRRALTKEAFGLHFLTDSFAAGHVRTPRAEIRQWYGSKFPDSTRRLLRYLAQYLFDRLDERQQLPPLAWWFGWVTRGAIVDRVQSLGGEAVKTFSLGDIVSLALHDYDNRGLHVVSDVDARGRPVSGGYRWRAVGDGHLGSNRFGIHTTQMAVPAVIASLRDLSRVRGVGVRLGPADVPSSQRMAAMREALGDGVFAARGFVPREDASANQNVALRTTDGTRAPLEWRWGQLGDVAYEAVDATVKKRLADELQDLATKVADPVHGPGGLRIYGTRNAYRAFVRHLRTDGITALEKAVGASAR